MIDCPTIIFASLLIFLYGSISHMSERSPITAPVVVAGIGIVVGHMEISLLDIKLSATVVKLIAEITLMLILFVDASTVNLGSRIEENVLRGLGGMVSIAEIRS